MSERRRWRVAAPGGRASRASLLYLAPALALYAAFVVWPLVRLGMLSLEQWDGLGAPSFVGLTNYAGLPLDPQFEPEAAHSALWLGVTLVVPTVAGLVLALLLRAVGARLRTPLRALLLTPLLLPTVVIAVAWRLLYNPLVGPLTALLVAAHLGGLAADWLGDPRVALGALLVPACWAGFGLSLVVCEAALAGVNPALLAAAQLDGAGWWASVRAVIWPALRGALPLATVATALCAVPSYDLVLLLTNGGPGYATTTLAFDAYGRAFGAGQVGVAAALAVLQALTGLGLAVAALLVARGQERQDAGGEGAGERAAPAGRAARSAAVVGLLAGTAATLAPLAWLAVAALRPAAGLSPPATLWENLAAVWGQGWSDAFLTSAAVAATVAACTLALAIPAAFALAAQGRSRIGAVLIVLLGAGLFQPVAVLIVPLYGLVQTMGLLDSPAGLVLPQVGRVLPVAVLLLWVGFRALPGNVLEAAATDGAAPRQVLRHVALPLGGPLAAVAGVWAFLGSWNDYLLPSVVLQDGSLTTVPLTLAHFTGRVDTEYGMLAAGALLASAPLLLLYGALYGVLSRGVRTLRRPVRG